MKAKKAKKKSKGKRQKSKGKSDLVRFAIFDRSRDRKEGRECRRQRRATAGRERQGRWMWQRLCGRRSRNSVTGSRLGRSRLIRRNCRRSASAESSSSGASTN